MTVNNNTVLQQERNVFGGAIGGEAVDAGFIIIITFIIFTMQSGFGLLESGMVSRKSESNVMVKNMLDVVIGGFGFWLLGYSFVFGNSSSRDSKHSFIGTGGYFLCDVQHHDMAKYLLQLGYSTTSTTIVSGAVAERIKLSSYMIFVFVQSTLVYSLPAHWIWNHEGWLKHLGVYDFAGGAVVHITGGAASLVAAIVLGPRHGRFSYDDKGNYGMACPTNVILGTFFLWWGWIGFNCGSTMALTGGMWQLAVRAGVSTMNGAIGGGLSGIALNLFLYRKRKYILDIPQFATSILGGLVSVTSSASVIESWQAILIGFIGGLIANGGVTSLKKIHIDDPVGCFGTHWLAGFWGMIACGFFAKRPESHSHIMQESGLFYGGSGRLLAYNVAACLVITLWSGGIILILFLLMKHTIGVRIGVDKELLGSDEVEHNIVEYVKTIETKHVFGKHVINKKSIQGQSNNGMIANIGPSSSSHVLVLKGEKQRDDNAK